jgi:hypothetical protein
MRRHHTPSHLLPLIYLLAIERLRDAAMHQRLRWHHAHLSHQMTTSNTYNWPSQAYVNGQYPNILRSTHFHSLTAQR